ncbi:MAG: EAL domain-containing protein [Alteromonadaceae bacterium]|nr:EAL domain-containing protein [Alteromonadaceae bacterium]
MHNRKKLTSIFFVTFLLGGVFASFNTHANVFDIPPERVTLKRISTEEGLSQGSVVTVFQDKQGYVWLGTYEGLNFYNGYDIRQFTGEQSSFKSSFVNFVFQPIEGQIWISVYDYGLFVYDLASNTQTLKYSSVDEPQNDVVDYIMSKDGSKVWFITATGLVEYRVETDSFHPLMDVAESFGEEQFFTTGVLHDDQFYLGSNKGLYVVDRETNTYSAFNFKTDPSNDELDAFEQRIRKLVVDPKNNIWAATARGLFHFSALDVSSAVVQNFDFIQVKEAVPAIQFRDIELHDGLLYVASEDGLLRVDPTDQSISLVLQFSRSNQDIYNNNINEIYIDRSGNFWLASNSRGIYVWNPKTRVFRSRFNSPMQGQQLAHNEVWAIKEGAPNELWIGTTNGLSHYDPKTEQHNVYLQSESELSESSHILQMQKDKTGDLWLSSYAGITYFDTQLKVAKPIPLADESYRSVFNDQQSFIRMSNDNKLWIVTLESFYVYDLQTTEITEVESLKTEVSPYFSFGFIGELPDSNVMLMSASGQLWGVDKTTLRSRKLFELQNYSPQEFTYIDNWVFDEKNGLIWLSVTDRGVFAISSQDYRVVYEHNRVANKPLFPVYGLIPDKQGRLWMSTHDGIFSLNMDSKHVVQYDNDYGLHVMEFNSGAYAELTNGDLIYGSVKGITRFNPEDIEANSDFHNRVYFDRVKVASGTDIETSYGDLAGQAFSLNYDDTGVEISFSTLGFDQQTSVEYEYQLISDEVIEYPRSRENSVYFPQLAPGHYEFRVVAFSPFTGYKTKPSTIYISVRHAPWASPLAQSIYALIAIMLVLFFVYRRRLKQQLLVTANRELFRSEERLRIALASSHSQAWEWSGETDRITFSSDNDNTSIQTANSKEHFRAIHSEDKREFLKEWQNLLDNPANDAFNLTYRLRMETGDYGWYRNVGRIVKRGRDRKPMRITGLLTDITEIKSVEESASLFGEAFRNTKDWVLIIVSEFNGVMANDSFYSAFNIEPNQPFSLRDDAFKDLSNKMSYYRRIMESMVAGEHWHGEDSVPNAEGQLKHLLINISLINVKSRDDHHYVVIFTDITAQKLAEEELRRMANYDPLTALPNRTLLIDRIEHAIQGADRNHNTLALLFLDLDRFKPVNDSLGHDYGDLLLKKIANRLKGRVRKQDTVARLGGDEFVVLLESFKDITHVGEVAQEIATHTGRPIQLGPHKVSVAPSIGIALYPSDAKTPEDLLRDADIAMYHAKKDPSNCFHFYTESMDFEVREKLQKEYDLKQAQVNQEFVNYYQPIIGAKTGDIVGAELLLRWYSPDGVVAPGDFISLSEQIGLIIPMTNDALSRGLKEVAVWRKQRPEFYLSLNLSVLHFEQANVAESMVNILKHHELPTSALRVEVTESALMSHPEKAITTMRRLMEYGIHLALDDFGTGYSSFAYLKRLPLNTVKLDRSFIWGIGQDEKDEIIIDAILAVADSLNLDCVAEGVESQEHIDFLKEHNCQYLQGFHFSKPLPFEEFCEYLRNFVANDQC